MINQVSRIREEANLLIEEELAARKIEGIAPAHGSVLVFLFRQTEPVPIKDVVAFTGRAKSTVTGMIQTLERHGYVARSGDLSDNRICTIVLTAKGRALRADFETISQHLVEVVYGQIPQRDRETLVRLLAEMEGNLVSWKRE